MSAARFELLLASGDVVRGVVQGCGGFLSSEADLEHMIRRAEEGEDSRMYEPKPGHARMFPSFCALEDGPPLDVPLAGAVIIAFEAQT